MKKLILVILACMLLASCEDKFDVSIIGGADGPTAITVSEKY